MARLKRTSSSVAFAENRINSLASIDAALDLGNNLTLAAYEAKKEAVKEKNDTYNTQLSELDGLLNKTESEEDELDELSTRMLAAVGVKYGKDSDEYEKAGGTKTSDRKLTPRRSKVVAK